MNKNILTALLAVSFLGSTFIGTSAQQISLISMNYAGTNGGNNTSTIATDGYRHSANGRYVGFLSFAHDIVPGDQFFSVLQLYVRDLQTNTTEIITKNYQTDVPSNSGAGDFEFSVDGRYLAFVSSASDLVPGTLNREPRLYRRDMQTGTLRVVEMDVPGLPDYGQFTRFSLSNDGKTLVFAALGWNEGFPLDRNHVEDVYVHDFETGATTLASVDRNGVRAGNRPSYLIQISGNGRYVLFASSAGNLVIEPVRSDAINLYVRDLLTGMTKLVSITRDGTGGSVADASANFQGGHQGWISDDGRYVTFMGLADEYVANDHNSSIDLFQRDLVLGVTSVVSANVAGIEAGNQGVGSHPSRGDYAVTPDVRYVIFNSLSSDLVPNDTNQNDDCFIRDTVTGITHSLSGLLPRAVPLSLTGSVDISRDGRYACFQLTEERAGLSGIHSHLYLHDEVTGQLTELTTPQGTFLGDVIGAGFSADSQIYLFSGKGSFMPFDTNNDYDVYAAQLAPKSKRRGPVVLPSTLGGQ
jgi:hypothetical protein